MPFSLSAPNHMYYSSVPTPDTSNFKLLKANLKSIFSAKEKDFMIGSVRPILSLPFRW